MEFLDALPFLEQQNLTVCTTLWRSGAPQSSIVVSGPYQGAQGLVAQGSSAKLVNLRRDPRCTLTIVKPDWSGFVVIEGVAAISDWANTDHSRLRVLLRDLYRAARHREHPNWEEYDKVMEEERRAAVIVTPLRVYGRTESGRSRSSGSSGAAR